MDFDTLDDTSNYQTFADSLGGPYHGPTKDLWAPDWVPLFRQSNHLAKGLCVFARLRLWMGKLLKFYLKNNKIWNNLSFWRTVSSLKKEDTYKTPNDGKSKRTSISKSLSLLLCISLKERTYILTKNQYYELFFQSRILKLDKYLQPK